MSKYLSGHDFQGQEFEDTGKSFEDMVLMPVLSNITYFNDIEFSEHDSFSRNENPIVGQQSFGTRFQPLEPQAESSRPSTPLHQDSVSSENSRYYTKNACKNIVKKSLRSIQKKIYEEKIKEFCSDSNVCYETFYKEMMHNLDRISGPSALKRLLTDSQVGRVFKIYLGWYLRERYVREAIKNGHMKHLKMYIEYKNNVLSRLL